MACELDAPPAAPRKSPVERALLIVHHIVNYGDKCLRRQSEKRSGVLSGDALAMNQITAQETMFPIRTTVPKARLGKRIGKLHDEDIVRLNRALTVFLGLAR